MNEFLDFKGEVSLYRDGVLKWTRSNKITYQGRAALLKGLSHSLSINKTRGNNFTDSIDVNSYLCGVAFGSGGTMNGSVLNCNTSYHDVGLYKPVPIRQLNETQYRNEDDTYKKDLNNYIAFADENVKYYIDNSRQIDANIDIHKYLYFKKISEITSVNSMTMKDSTNNFSFESSFITFSISIDQSDFKVPSANVTSISELGLYLGTLKYDVAQIERESEIDPEIKEKFDPRLRCQDGNDMLYRQQQYEAKKHNCSYFISGSLPVMFSHITFPAEDILEPKDLTFKYSIFV